MTKIIPDLSGPKYGFRFKIYGFQLETEDGTYSDLISVEGDLMNEMVFKIYKDYRKFKETFSNNICMVLNSQKGGKKKKKKWKKVCTILIRYSGFSNNHYI